MLAAALCLGACWTGSDGVAVEPTTTAKPAAAEPIKLRVKLERTGCFGTCPAYSVAIESAGFAGARSNADALRSEIDGAGRVEWIGHANVATMGRAEGRVSRFEVDELARRIDKARFFERDEYGELPQKPECQTQGSMTTCSFGTSVTICSDTSHSIVTVARGIRRHRVDNDHCNDRPELESLEEYIDRIANTEQWIAP